MRTRCIRKAQVASRKQLSSYAAQVQTLDSQTPRWREYGQYAIRRVAKTGPLDAVSAHVRQHRHSGEKVWWGTGTVREGGAWHTLFRADARASSIRGLAGSSSSSHSPVALALHVINGVHLMLRTSKAVREAVHTRSSFLGGLAILAKRRLPT